MYLIIILLVFGVGMFLLFKRVDFQKENTLEELVIDKEDLPKRALVKSEILFRILDRDMTLGRANSLIFYYKLEKHKMGVELYNNKYVLRYDDQLYESSNSMKNTAILNHRRLADIDDPITITEIIYPDTKIQALLENDSLLKDYIIDGSNKYYDLNIKYDEIK